MADEASRAEDKPDFPRDAKPWHALLREAERRDDAYHTRCDRVDEAYACLKDRSASDRELQVFWANLQVLMPTIYSRPPVPVVSPRFRDRKPLPRRASELVERTLITDIELDKVHDKLILARDDLARNARGVMWVVADRNPVRARAKWIPRKDFRHGWGRSWEEVPWVAKAAFLTKDEFKRRFGDVPKGTEFRVREKHVEEAEKEGFDAKARCWEIWHKGKGKVVWVADGAETISDAQDPWVDLDEFWPVPRPAYGTLVPETLTPVPDVAMYQDQLEEINELTDRIAKLTDTLKLKGFYAAGSGDIGGAIELAMADLDNRTLLVPVSSMAALGGAGMKDAIMWMPIAEVAQTLQVSIEVRKQLMQDVYEITGLSDIMRGATEAQETLGAQQLKAQFGSVRVKERQSEMQRLARDIFRIKAEIMAEQYEPEEMLSMSQIDDLPSAQDLQQQAQQIQQQAWQQAQSLDPNDPQAQQQLEQGAQAVQAQLQELSQTVTIDAVMQLLRDNRIRPFAIEVETDSTIEPDQMAEKQTRTEFMQALGPMLQQGVAAMQSAPQLGKFVAEAIRFVASGFKVPRSMDDAVDELAEGFANYQPQPQPGGEDPQAAQAQAQAAMVKAQADAQKAQTDAQVAQQDVQLRQQEAGLKAEEIGAKVELTRAQTQKVLAEIGKVQREAEAAEQQAQVDTALKVRGQQQAEAQSAQDAQFREREFARSAEQQQVADKRADAESKAKVQAMNKPKGAV